MSRDEAQELTAKALEAAEVPEVEVRLLQRKHGFLRFARNAPTTSGLTQTGGATVTAWRGKRKATVAGSIDLANAANALVELRRLIGEAEQAAKLSPEDPEYMPLLGPQEYPENQAFDAETADLSAARRAKAVAEAIGVAKQRKVIAAGFFENVGQDEALANSAGLFAYHRGSVATFSLTARTADDKGSGYTAVSSHRAAGLDFKETAGIAAKKAVDSRGGRAIDPAAYPAILEPQAVADIVGNTLPRVLDARQADEGRSVFAAPEGKTRLGERIFDPRVSIYADPAHPLIPSSPIGPGGYPVRRASFVREGVLENLIYSRFWAAKHEAAPGPFLSNLVIDGSDTPLAKLIASTERGVLVTRLWYIRMVDPQQALYTGLTRDGLFWIEDGEIRYPLKNLRFNESPYRLLQQVDALAQTQPAVAGERYSDFRMLLPAMRVKQFRFTSVSDAV